MQLLRVVYAAAFLLAATAGLVVGQPVSPPVKAPPPPARYDVELRYRINAPRAARIAQFLALTRFLESVGFQKDPGEDTEAEDPTETRMTGTIASANALRLLDDPRVKSLLLMPEGYKLPDDFTAPVKVQLGLVAGLPLDRQRLLADQVLAKLAGLGFREAVGYDNRGHTRLVGSIPRGQLDTLLEDLRGQPAGWLAPQVPAAELPAPLRNFSPLRVTEVTPEPEGVPPAREQAPPPAPAPREDTLFKVDPALLDLARREARLRATRMEVILALTPPPGDREWRRALTQAAPGLAIEGRMGPIVTVLASPRSAARLAELPVVSGVRLPRPALFSLRPGGPAKDAGEALRASGLEDLHARGYRGKGIRVALIDGDFRGYAPLVGKRLPASTRYLDLTAERNRTLEPDEFPSPPGTLGRGTQAALALAVAAPEAELTLIRIDPAAPHLVQNVARFLMGEPFFSDLAALRNAEFDAEAERLSQRSADLTRRREELLQSYGENPDPSRRPQDVLKNPAEVEREARQREEALRKDEADLAAQEATYRQRQARFVSLEQGLRDLKGVRLVASTLVWNEGYPLAGNGPLTRFFDDQPPRWPLWFQAAGDTRGQSWSGMFRDVDGNGVMEFAPPEEPLRPGKWTPELNFLGWQPFGRPQAPELPAGARVRLSVQWTEPHDPEFFGPGEDLYRRPLADLRLMVLRQRDPSGTKLPADDLEVTARTLGVPQRIDSRPEGATYEQWVEFTVDPAGRYAVRVEGTVPAGIRPAGTATLPALQRDWELWPRLFVEVVDGPSRLQGRPLFLDYATDAGSLGTPADARTVITVGAADLSGRPEPYSTEGPPLNRGLLVKPTVLAYDVIGLGVGGKAAAYGTALATPFAAGLTACRLSAGERPFLVQRACQPPPERLLRAP
jgi:hypothetical protein